MAKTDEEKAEEKLGFDRNGFNQFRSDRIPLDRYIPDNRHSRLVNLTSFTYLITVCMYLLVKDYKLKLGLLVTIH